MSRCFPYPPPGYTRKVAGTEAALIESIKLQSERQQRKVDRKKEKSKHKKEKSRDKKHKSRKHKEKSSRSRDLKDQKQKECVKEAKSLKGTKVEAEQVEKSGLTEEHGQPVWPQSPTYLSDGTQINHKRKRDATSQPNEGCKPGKIFRIKLASSLSQQEDLLAGSEQTCSTSGRDSSLDQKRDENINGQPIQQKTCFTNADNVVAVKDATSKPKVKDPRSVHAVNDLIPKGNAVLLPLPLRTRSSAESAYEALFEKWVPPPLQLEQQTDDEEWLFGTRTRKHDELTMKINKAFSPVPSCRSSSLWPRAQYLSDADVYSLPYTIPF